MNTWILNSTCGALIAALAVVGPGCEQSIDREDVEAAREEVAKERQETVEARREAAEMLAEENVDDSARRHRVLKVPIREQGDVRTEEERREAEAARQEAIDAVRTEEDQTIEAEREAMEAEARFEAQEAREDYVEEVNRVLDETDRRIEQLEGKAETVDDAAMRERLEGRVSRLQDDRQAVEEALERLESADALDWSRERDAVQHAVDRLTLELNGSF